MSYMQAIQSRCLSFLLLSPTQNTQHHQNTHTQKDTSSWVLWVAAKAQANRGRLEKKKTKMGNAKPSRMDETEKKEGRPHTHTHKTIYLHIQS